MSGDDGILFALLMFVLFNCIVSTPRPVGGNTDEIASGVREAEERHLQQYRYTLEP